MNPYTSAMPNDPSKTLSLTGVKCPDCKGSGRIALFTSAKECAACRGTGGKLMTYSEARLMLIAQQGGQPLSAEVEKSFKTRGDAPAYQVYQLGPSSDWGWSFIRAHVSE